MACLSECFVTGVIMAIKRMEVVCHLSQSPTHSIHMQALLPSYHYLPYHHFLPVMIQNLKINQDECSMG